MEVKLPALKIGKMDGPCFPAPAMVWKKSTCKEKDLLGSMVEGLLQSREVVDWHPATDVWPTEFTNETPLFTHFVERGLALPPSDFFYGLLFFYDIQGVHLNPNGIIQVSIFVHLCEAFFGIKLHFNLFRYLFCIKPFLGKDNPNIVRGVGFQLC